MNAFKLLSTFCALALTTTPIYAGHHSKKHAKKDKAPDEQPLPEMRIEEAPNQAVEIVPGILQELIAPPSSSFAPPLPATASAPTIPSDFIPAAEPPSPATAASPIPVLESPQVQDAPVLTLPHTYHMGVAKTLPSPDSPVDRITTAPTAETPSENTLKQQAQKTESVPATEPTSLPDAPLLVTEPVSTLSGQPLPKIAPLPIGEDSISPLDRAEPLSTPSIALVDPVMETAEVSPTKNAEESVALITESISAAEQIASPQLPAGEELPLVPPPPAPSLENVLPLPYSTLAEILPFQDEGSEETPEIIKELVTTHSIRTILEVGAHWGASTRHLASCLPQGGKVYAVDSWEDAPSDYAQFLSNMIHARLTDKVIPCPENTLSLTQEPRETPIDLIYFHPSTQPHLLYEQLLRWSTRAQPEGILFGIGWNQETTRKDVIRFYKEQQQWTLKFAGPVYCFFPKRESEAP